MAARGRMRRRWRVLAASAGVLMLVVGLLTWWLARFPAEAGTLAGTQFELEVQAGVPATEVQGIRAGLQAMDAHLRADLGGGVDGPVLVRVSWSDGCRFLLGPQSVATAWADGADFICLNAAHDRWRSSVERPAWFPAYVAAHEHVHDLPAHLGCVPPRRPRGSGPSSSPSG